MPKPFVLRDPVHDLIPFEDTRTDRLLAALINTREFQRLRHIRQLGFGDLVFPGATHSRMSHSIGVLAIARQLLNHIQTVQGEAFPEEQQVAVLVGSLLHDIGHGPFSHAFEHVVPTNHEIRTEAILLNEATEVHIALRKYSKQLPQHVAAFFSKSSSAKPANGFPAFLPFLVSGQFDADRLDYLRRDALCCGVSYGHIDVPWMISNLRITDDHQFLFMLAKASSALEEYVVARHHMYRSVYFHKATRSAEVMLSAIFDRIRHQYGAILTQRALDRIVPQAPREIAYIFSKSPPITQFCALNDHTIWAFLEAATQSRDVLIAGLAEGLVRRKLYKSLDLTALCYQDVYLFSQVKVALQSWAEDTFKGECAYKFINQMPSYKAYPLYSPDAGDPQSWILIQDTDQSIRELSQVSPAVQALTSRSQLFRFHFPPEYKEAVARRVTATIERASR